MKPLLFSTLIVSLAACATGAGNPATQRSGQGRTVAVKFRSYPANEEVDLAKDRGSVVLVDFWATWCEPCKEALPAYQMLEQQYGRQGLRVYAVNIDEDDRKIVPFLQQTGIKLAILWDPRGVSAERDFGVRMMPTSFLLDRKGVIRHVHEGAIGDSLAVYRSEIERLLHEAR